MDNSIDPAAKDVASGSRHRALHTSRFNLIATLLHHLDAELEISETGGYAALSQMLGAIVPAGWPPGLYDTDAMRYFRDCLSRDGDDAVGWYGWYVVTRPTDTTPATLVASAGYFGPPQEGIVEIGYSVVEQFRGRGIATEAIGALRDAALTVPGVRCVVAHTARDNMASQRALERAGFTPTEREEMEPMLRFECWSQNRN
ncbi:MAG: GNAT family N-acetyltransferase [bacterium]